MSTDTLNKSNIETIEPVNFYEKIKSKKDNFIILDIRSEEVSQDWELDFENIDVINYPYYNILDEIPEELHNKLPTNQEIIVVCTKGESSKMIANKLDNKDYDATVLENGTNGWAKVYQRRKIPTDSNLLVYQYERPSSGCLSYLLISNDEAVVIDPLKQYTDTYIQDAKDNNANIEYIIDTHIHADHISGFNLLSDETGATKVMYENSNERGVQHSFNSVKHKDSIDFGSETIKVLNTPGHTTDMTSYHVNNMLFTGDSLFLNSLARPDLENMDEIKDMAQDLYRSMNDILQLPDETIIAPGHKFTNHPTQSLNATFTDHLHKIDERIGLSEYNKKHFVDEIISDIPPRPSNYSTIISINKGQKNASESEEYELELGPNNCSAS